MTSLSFVFTFPLSLAHFSFSLMHSYYFSLPRLNFSPSLSLFHSLPSLYTQFLFLLLSLVHFFFLLHTFPDTRSLLSSPNVQFLFPRTFLSHVTVNFSSDHFHILSLACSFPFSLSPPTHFFFLIFCHKCFLSLPCLYFYFPTHFKNVPPLYTHFSSLTHRIWSRVKWADQFCRITWKPGLGWDSSKKVATIF